MQKIIFPTGTIRKLLLSKVELLQFNSSYLPALEVTTYYQYPFNPSQLRASLYNGNSTDNSNLDDLNTSFNPSTVTIVVVLVIAFLVLIFFSIYVRRCTTDDSTGDHNNRRPVTTAQETPLQGLDKALVDKLPLVFYSIGTGAEDAKDVAECVVCLSEFEENETLRLLPKCGHTFHQECLDMWLFSHTTCPLCRLSLLDKEGSFHETRNHSGNPIEGEFTFAREESGSEIGVQGSQAFETDVVVAIPDCRMGFSSPQSYRVPETSSSVSKSRSRRSRRFRRSHSTGHYLAKQRRNDIPVEGSSSSSLTSCLTLLASDFHRSRSCTAASSRPWSLVGQDNGNSFRRYNSFSWRKGMT